MDVNKVCKKCGGTERNHSDRCSVCARANASRRYYSNPEASKKVAREWKQANRERGRASSRKGGRTDWKPGEHEKAETRLKITECCDVCGSKDPRHMRGWCADHNHKTGLFRGIVCHPCNLAISHVDNFGLDRGPQIARYLNNANENKIT